MIGKTLRNHWMTVTVGILVAFYLAGCGSSRFGRLQPDPAVTQMFTANGVPTEYHYFICGRPSLPYIIVGIEPQFQFADKLWQSTQPNTTDFSQQVNFVWIPEVWYKVEPAQGCWIIDPAGRKVGVWYSMYPSAPVVFKDNRVSIGVPYDEGG
ncbi:MAG: hypothetical protein M0036_18815 [Desulfobacteraceae bacterium]|nr:hypothetical protein [Desulfobacteraceae bacterium]